MNKKFLKSKTNTLLLLGLLFLVILFICNLFVNTHDDIYTIGTPSIKEAFDYSINYGNGRYLGNLLVTFLCNRMVINNIVRACSIFFIICIIPVLFGRFKNTEILLSTGLVLGILTSFFGSVYVWSHGFYNYVPPVVLLLLSVYLLKCMTEKRINKFVNVFLTIILALCGFCQQLFSENSTVINCVVALIIFAISIKNKKCRAEGFVFLISNIGGAALMYFGPKAMDLGDKLDFYRGSIFGNDFIAHITENLTVISSTPIYMMVLIIAYFILFSLNILNDKGKSFKEKKLLICVLLITLPIIVGILSFSTLSDNRAINLFLSSLGIILYLFYFFLLIYCANKLFSKETSKVFTTLMIIALISVGELVFVYPIRARCFYITYILLCIAFFTLFKEGINDLSETSKKICSITIKISTIAVFVLLICIYIPIKQANDARLEYINEQMSQHKTTIEMVELPNDNWLVDANNTNLNAIVYNYGNPDEMNFVYITYSEYMKKTNIDTQ